MGILRKLSLAAVGLFAAFIMVSPTLVSAVDLVPAEVCNKNNASDSPACKKPGGDPLFGSGGVFAVAVNILSVIVAIAAVIIIMLAGLKFITSGSNPQEVTKAREMILYAIIGLVIAAFAQIIVRLFVGAI